ncbi:hypothetical protein [Polaromonas sp. UBA4122]|uniref:hypothetical protein n=1 Tax=Polaromonas sp. UBA4122 TaxID=1947074 RepID=UPI0025F46318|nr:hypothetical protein [Polaromonas sp. UBA4122]
MKYLAVLLSSTMLVACGGGGSGSSDASASPSSAVSSSASSSPAVSPANAELAKYEGVWRQDCLNHMRLTMTSTATSSTIFSVMRKEEYFDNPDCTGALVATGSFGQLDETVQYTATLANASVTLLTGETVVANVDPATSVLAVAPFTITGSGVKSTYVQGMTFATIAYANGEYVVIQRAALSGKTTHGALLLRNGELLALVPVGDPTTSFQVNHRYIR